MSRISSTIFSLIAIAISFITTPDSSAQTGGGQTSPKRVWTAAEILNERKPVSIKKRPRYCYGGVFKPCVCARDVPTITQYRPSVQECGGNAAIILSGKYTSLFSVVVRDRENKDRWPPNGANSCTLYETNVLALNKCSVFKVQNIIEVEHEKGDAEIHCLGASGYSTLFRNVTRITAKISDIPGSNKDPLARWCLAGPTKPLN